MTGCQLSLYVHFLAFILDFYTAYFNTSMNLIIRGALWTVDVFVL